MNAQQFIEHLNEHLDQLIKINSEEHPEELKQYYRGKIDAYEAVKESLRVFKPIV